MTQADFVLRELRWRGTRGIHTNPCNPVESGALTKLPRHRLSGPGRGTEGDASMQHKPTVGDGFCGCGCGEVPPLAKVTRTGRGHVKGWPVRFVPGHQTRKSPVEYVKQDMGYETPCWIWQRARTAQGYGYTRGTAAHRDYYEQHVGPIPTGMVIDHLCRIAACVNPAHLEAVTNAENVRRGNKAKLTAEQVAEIRASALGCRRLARQYGVARVTILGIRAGRRWVAA